jgi:hypothetical protein
VIRRRRILSEQPHQPRRQQMLCLHSMHVGVDRPLPTCMIERGHTDRPAMGLWFEAAAPEDVASTSRTISLVVESVGRWSINREMYITREKTSAWLCWKHWMAVAVLLITIITCLSDECTATSLHAAYTLFAIDAVMHTQSMPMLLMLVCNQ